MKTTRRLLRHSPAHRQRGGVTLLLVMVLIVLAALVGVLAVRGATADLQMAGSQRVSRTGFYCAEGGLNYARALVAQHPADWNTILSTGSSGGATPWYPTGGITPDLDGDNKPDVTVVMTDNVDSDGVFTHDNDLTVILTATCNSTTLEANSATRTLSQVVTYAGNGGTDYRYQAGHSSTHSGNAN
ncbi:MAG TPA: pilus assembly PilX N-terminal domain-containing protein [Polyangia bacterium]